MTKNDVATVEQAAASLRLLTQTRPGLVSALVAHYALTQALGEGEFVETILQMRSTLHSFDATQSSVYNASLSARVQLLIATEGESRRSDR